jgi:branched-chain amino acid aminotransferase
MIVTRGQPPWGSRDPRQASTSSTAFAVPYVWLASEEQRRRGLHVSSARCSAFRRPAWIHRQELPLERLTMGLLGALDAGADTGAAARRGDNVIEGPGFKRLSRSCRACS